MGDEIDAFFDQVRTHMKKLSPEFGEELGDDMENSFYGMYAYSNESGDRIDQVDRLLEIIRRDCPFEEKYEAYVKLMDERPRS
jgi:hypothetical protein